jgi:hypothetical protein
MPKLAPLDRLGLYQIDYNDGSQNSINELSIFTVESDGSWSEIYDIAGDSVGPVTTSGHLTDKEFRDLSRLFVQFEKKAFVEGPVERPDVTLTDYYNLDASNADFGFYNVIYDNGSMQAIEYGQRQTVEKLDAYVRGLVAEYAHGIII